MNDSDLMRIAIKEAFIGIRKKHGNPFGAVVAKNGKIIARAHNMVFKQHDPTAHAEVTAIRKASKKLKNRHLEGCVIYCSSEPCPMCMCAIFWARMKKVYYACGRNDAAKIGFGDALFYKLLSKGGKKNFSKQMMRKEALAVFGEWKRKKR